MTPYFARRLSRDHRGRLFADILDDVRARRARGTAVVVFDLDGTLMDNRPRVVAILHELAEHWRERHPEAAACVRKAYVDGIVYGLADNLAHLGVTDPKLVDEGFAFWRERFFADPHMRHDLEVPGARAFAEACYRQGAILVYLTGRDLPNMALGSFASLRDLGFPIGVPGTELVVKPRFEVPDAEFKRGIAPTLDRLGPVVATFDNEPANANLFLEAHPSARHVFLDTQYAPNPPSLHPDVHVVESFEVDL